MSTVEEFLGGKLRARGTIVNDSAKDANRLLHVAAALMSGRCAPKPGTKLERKLGVGDWRTRFLVGVHRQHTKYNSISHGETFDLRCFLESTRKFLLPIIRTAFDECIEIVRDRKFSKIPRFCQFGEYGNLWPNAPVCADLLAIWLIREDGDDIIEQVENVRKITDDFMRDATMRMDILQFLCDHATQFVRSLSRRDPADDDVLLAATFCKSAVYKELCFGKRGWVTLDISDTADARCDSEDRPSARDYVDARVFFDAALSPSLEKSWKTCCATIGRDAKKTPLGVHCRVSFRVPVDELPLSISHTWMEWLRTRDGEIRAVAEFVNSARGDRTISAHIGDVHRSTISAYEMQRMIFCGGGDREERLLNLHFKDLKDVLLNEFERIDIDVVVRVQRKDVPATTMRAKLHRGNITEPAASEASRPRMTPRAMTTVTEIMRDGLRDVVTDPITRWYHRVSFVTNIGDREGTDRSNSVDNSESSSLASGVSVPWDAVVRHAADQFCKFSHDSFRNSVVSRLYHLGSIHIDLMSEDCVSNDTPDSR